MEVHHHTHNPKKWKEYLSEFFMLFMAVFAGFMAESYLEYRTERHKEHDYLVSLVSDLKIDSADISQKEKNMKEVVEYGSLLSDIVYVDKWMDKYADSMYIWSESMYVTEISLQFADGTIDQLKNAGGFRLIKSKEIAEKIKDYMKGQKRIKEQGIGMDQRMQQLLTEKSNIMYARVFDYTGNVLEGKSIVTLKNNKLNKIQAKTGSKFLNNDLKEFTKLSNTSFYFIGQLYVYREMALSQQQQATELIKLIQAEIQ
jgi:hypothetical protein